MKAHILNKTRYFFIAAFLFVSFSACDSSNPDEDPPAVMPEAVFALPVDLFDQSASKTSSPPGINFTAAALRVWPVSAIIGANLIIPSLTTIQALDTTPVFEDNAWVWKATTTAEGVTVDFNLSATRNGATTLWSMKISSSSQLDGQTLDNFELFTAETSNSSTAGSWKLYYLINGSSTNVLDASYTHTSDTEKSITFSIPQTAAENAGDSVEYGENGSTRTFVWRQVAENITHDVTWDHNTAAGSISATNFNGGTMGCWDETLADTACSPS